MLISTIRLNVHFYHSHPSKEHSGLFIHTQNTFHSLHVHSLHELQEKWNTLPQMTTGRIIHSMPCQLNECLTNHGSITHYCQKQMSTLQSSFKFFHGHKTHCNSELLVVMSAQFKPIPTENILYSFGSCSHTFWRKDCIFTDHWVNNKMFQDSNLDVN